MLSMNARECVEPLDKPLEEQYEDLGIAMASVTGREETNGRFVRQYMRLAFRLGMDAGQAAAANAYSSDDWEAFKDKHGVGQPPKEPQPPTELVAFAERHGAEVDRPGHQVRVGRAWVSWQDASEDMRRGLSFGANLKPHHFFADTIDEALAKLAAATVDDVEAHLEVVGLIEDVRAAFGAQYRKAEFEATPGHGWRVEGGTYRGTPWLARLASMERCHARLADMEDDNA